MVFLLTSLGWACYYMCQRTVPAATAALSERGYSKEDFGLVTSCLAVTYALSVFVTGFLSDRLRPNVLMSIGLAFCGLSCAAFPLADTVVVCCLVWAVQGLFQGCGWPACVATLRQWCRPSEIGLWWSLVSSSGNVGAAVAPLVVAYISELVNWQVSFFVIGGVSAVSSVVIFLTVSSPPSKQTSLVAKPSTKPVDGSVDDPVMTKPAEDQRWFSVLFFGDVWIITGVYIVFWMVKASVGDWLQLYLYEVANMSDAAGGSVPICCMYNNLLHQGWRNRPCRPSNRWTNVFSNKRL